MLTLVEGSIGPLSIAIGLLQFPIIGGMIGWASARQNRTPIGIAEVAYIAALVVCFSGALEAKGFL
jgi:hypothetical protein